MLGQKPEGNNHALPIRELRVMGGPPLTVPAPALKDNLSVFFSMI